MPRFTPLTQPQIQQRMVAKLITRAGISDVGDASVAKHILAAAARSDAEQYYQMMRLLKLFSIDTATGDDLDERAKDMQPSTITRDEAAKASGFVVFSRSGTSGSVTIPSGSRVKTADSVEFVTTAVGTITSTSAERVTGHGVGRDSNLVSCLAVEAGTDGNVAAETVVRFSSKPAGVDEVTNLTAFSSGTDTETDDSFRSRIQEYIAGLARCTVGAIEANLIGEQDPDSGQSVLFVKVVEDSVNPGYITIYVDDGTGTAETTEEIAEALSVDYTWDGTTTVLTSDTSDIDEGDWIRLDSDEQFFEVQSVVEDTSVEISNPGALTIPTGAGASSKSGDLVTYGLAGPPPNTAVGGETSLYLEYPAIKSSIAPTVWSSTRGLLSVSTDYYVNYATGQIYFPTALSTGEAIAANYTRYTGLVAYVQKIVDGDSDDRENYPGLRAAGIMATVTVPQVLLQNVVATITAEEGYDSDDVRDSVVEAVKEYINGLSISGDVIRAELISRIMGVSGVYNVTLTTPDDDRVILDDQLIRTQDSNITIS
jgi:uncharacterized phage protein gp47/JayE